MTPRTEQFALLPDAKIVFSRDRQNCIMRDLTDAALQAADLSRLGYEVVGCVATMPDGLVNGIAEYGCGPLIANALAVFLYDKREAKKPVPPVAWLEKLWAWDGDPRS
jgi:hypothetical protein